MCKGCGVAFKHKYESARYCSLACYRSTPEYKNRGYESVKRFRSRNIEELRARDSLGKRTMRRFKEKEPCVVCGKENVHAHHPDYDKPYEIVFVYVN